MLPSKSPSHDVGRGKKVWPFTIKQILKGVGYSLKSD